MPFHTGFTPSFLSPSLPCLVPLVAKDWAGDQEVDLELSVCSLASCWGGSQKQMTLYLCPCRKCHSGLWLWVGQHAEQKCACPRHLSDDEDRVGLDNRNLRIRNHPKGNTFAPTVALHVILQMLNLYAKM